MRALFSGVSRGTEALVFQGRVPVSEHERMRAPFQAGAFPAPVKYGYASVGTSSAARADLQGRRVFTLFPHQTRYVVPARSVHGPARRRAAGARGAGGEPRDRDQRAVGRAAARRRSRDRHRRRHRRLPGRLDRRPDRRLRSSSSSTSTRSARRSRARSACVSPTPASARPRRRRRDPRERLGVRARARASPRRPSRRRSSR